MRKKIQLTIPTPCHENWDAMLPADKGRFCQSCSKEVIDFTMMSDTQLVAFFKKPSNGSVCGRFMDDQLDRQIAKPRKQLPWIKYFFQFALPAFLITSKTYSQGEVKGKVAPTCNNQIKGDTISITSIDVVAETKAIKGIVKDKNGDPVVGSNVYIKGTRKGTISDTAGNFSLNISASEKFVTLVINCIGFQPIEKRIDLLEYKPEEIVLLQLEYAFSGEVIVAGIVRPQQKKVVPLIERIFRDTVFRKFSVYPNPVAAGNSIILRNKKLPDDNYDIKIIDLSGQLVHRTQLQIDSKGQVMLNIPSVTPGTYFISLTGRKKSKTYSEKLIIR